MNLGGYAEQFCNSFIVLSKAQGGVERFFSILEHPDEAELYGSEELSGRDISIKLRDIQVQYPNKSVLDHLNLELRTGEYIALVGESGAGKTTLLNVILQFVNHKGEYTINGKNVNDYSLKEFCKIFSYIPQKPEIFNSTIRENILCGNPEAGEEELTEAARLAGAYEFIEQLPDKYDTLITDNGGNLSGGERQRIAIARAFIKNAPVLVLDEFTSALDSETENGIKLALEKIKEGKLVIMVAHRGSMINAAEKTVVI